LVGQGHLRLAQEKYDYDQGLFVTA
jgi:hypothetical protein